LKLDFQKHLDRFPGTNGPVNPYNNRQGELDTLSYLWAHKDNIERIAAILINASLFTRLHSSRNHYPTDYWPSHNCVNELANWAYRVWNDNNHFFSWQHYHTEVLPYMNWDYEFKLNDMNALVCYLADEHALVFLNHRPVSIVFRERREPFIERILNELNEV